MIVSRVVETGLKSFFTRRFSTSVAADVSNEIIMDLPKSSLVVRLFGSLYVSVTAIVGTITAKKIYDAKYVQNKDIGLKTWAKYIFANALCVWILVVHTKVCARIPVKIALNESQNILSFHNLTPFLYKTRESLIPIEWIQLIGAKESVKSIPIVYKAPNENFNRNAFIIVENPDHPIIKYLFENSNQINQKFT